MFPAVILVASRVLQPLIGCKETGKALGAMNGFLASSQQGPGSNLPSSEPLKHTLRCLQNHGMQGASLLLKKLDENLLPCLTAVSSMQTATTTLLPCYPLC